MRVISGVFGAVGVVAGFIMLYLAYNTTTILNVARLNGAAPSAVQITQVYSEASFYGIIAIACFAFAVVMAVSVATTFLAELILFQLEHEDERRDVAPADGGFSTAPKRN